MLIYNKSIRFNEVNVIYYFINTSQYLFRKLNQYNIKLTKTITK